MTTLRTIGRRITSAVAVVPPRQLSVARRGIGIGIIGALILLPELTGSPYVLSLGSIVAVDAALGMAVVVLMGFAGELSFAYGVLYGAAAYVNYEVASHGGGELLALAAGIVGATMIGILIAIPAARVRGLQLSLATFVMGLAGQDIFGRLSGYGGTTDLPLFTVFGHVIITPEAEVVLWGVVTAILYAIVVFLMRGRVGRLFLLLKADEPTARSLGIFTARARVVAFGLSSLLLGVVGTLYPNVLGLLDPSGYSFQTVVTLLIVVFIGGVSWPEGALVGAIAVVAIGQLAGSTPGLESIIYGLVLVVLLAVAPQGLIGVLSLFERGARIGAMAEEAVDVPLAEATTELIDATMASSAERADPVTVSASVAPIVFQARGVAKTFGRLRAVDGVDLDIRAGRITAIAGANGAGKSTLLDLLTGFQRPDTGTVLVSPKAGAELRSLNGRRADQIARAGVVRTFQFPGIVEELTIGENVLIAAESSGLGRREARIAVSAALAVVGLGAAEALRARNLPHGTKKLIDVARVICQRPSVALFDEPSSGLGSAELPWLAKGIRSLAEGGAAVVVIEHNMEFIGLHAEAMVALDFGKVIASGTPAEVLGADVVRQAYLGEGSVVA